MSRASPRGARHHPPVLDRRTLNRTILRRQLLLERVDRPTLDVVEHLVGMQAQVPEDPYVALWSRVRAFDPATLSDAIEHRQAVRLTVMRTTLHLATAPDAVSLRAVIQPVIERAFGGSSFRRNLDGVEIDEVVAAGVAAIEDRPDGMAALGRSLQARWPDRDPLSLAYAVRYLAPLVQVPPRGLWRRTGPARVTTFRSWLGEGELPAPDVGSLVARYLRAFGPASVADIRTWSGLTGLGPTIDALRPSLRIYRDEAGRELLDVEDGPIADADEPAPVRFLPQFDNLFLSHADRTRVTGDGRWGSSYTGYGTVFVDGFLAAAWRLDRRAARPTLIVESRTPISTSDLVAVRAEAEALLGFLVEDAADSEVVVA